MQNQLMKFSHLNWWPVPQPQPDHMHWTTLQPDFVQRRHLYLGQCVLKIRSVWVFAEELLYHVSDSWIPGPLADHNSSVLQEVCGPELLTWWLSITSSLYLEHWVIAKALLPSCFVTLWLWHLLRKEDWATLLVQLFPGSESSFYLPNMGFLLPNMGIDFHTRPLVCKQCVMTNYKLKSSPFSNRKHWHHNYIHIGLIPTCRIQS